MTDFPREPQHVTPSRGKFPPARGNGPANGRANDRGQENATITSGKGGIQNSLAVKRAGTKPSPGKEKNVNLS